MTEEHWTSIFKRETAPVTFRADDAIWDAIYKEQDRLANPSAAAPCSRARAVCSLIKLGVAYKREKGIT